MKPKTLVLLLVAVGCGLVAAVLVGQMVKAKPVAKGDEYLIAKVNMNRGDKITNLENQFRVQEFAPGTAPPGAISKAAFDAKPQDVLGKVLTQPIQKDETITERHLKDDNVMEKCPEGFKAMAVPVKVDTAVAGFVQPGVRVDLLCTYSKDGRQMTKTFLQNILVLAADTKTSKEVQAAGDQPGAITPPATLTLAVKPQMAQAISWARRNGGDITMTLRRADDTKINSDLEPTDGLDKAMDEDPKDGPKEKKDTIFFATQDLDPKFELPRDRASLEKLFESKTFPASPLHATFVKNLDQLEAKDGKKKIVQVAIKKGSPVTFNAFGELAPVEIDEPKVAQTHILKIFNGPGAPPIVARYERQGNSWTGSAAGGADQPPSTPMTPPSTPSTTPTPMPTPGTVNGTEGK